MHQPIWRRHDVYCESAAELAKRRKDIPAGVPPMSRSEFEAYFFAGDVIVGIGEERPRDGKALDKEGGIDALLTAKGDRDGSDVIPGFYYARSILGFLGRSSRD